MKKYLICAFALAAFCACSSGADEEQVKPNENGQVYMQFSVKMETSRSETDETGDTNSNANPDYEVGFDKENAISTVDVVLRNADDYVVAEDVVPAKAATDTYVASFNTLDLKVNATYDVYIYANCKADQNLDATSAETIENITKDNKFWMTNAYAAQSITLPSDLSLYTQPNNPLNLQSHYVERVMARFDYMASKTDNIYPMAVDAENAATVNLQLTDVALINMSKNFYMLRRVSNDGTNNGWTIGGAETPSNYVVDTDYAAKAAGYTEAQVANFYYHMTKPADWEWTKLATLTTDDNWTGEGDKDHNPSDYKVWRYAIENTIPNINAQKHGISTGVVFKGEIKATDKASEALQNALKGKETIYVFKNQLYGTWADVTAAAVKSETNTEPDAELAAAYNAVVAAGENATVQTYADAGFTGYSPEADGKFYAYYYYWNRHNDNLENDKMGQMEFAVVRNNVYKLCVDKIARYGHPTPGGNDPDPDPEKPTDPDEELNYYFTVTVKVLPWVVRVNHIEF